MSPESPTRSNAPASPVTPGLRERNKQEKLARIIAAARQLFAEKGFEATTTREIAERAQVGSGTLFLYVKDKQELLLVVFREQIERVQAEAFSTIPPELPLIDALLHIFGTFYRYYAQEPALSRVFLKELMFLGEGHLQELSRLDQAFFVRLAELLSAAQTRGELRPDFDLITASFNFFAAYCLVLMAWYNGTLPKTEAQLEMLRRSLELQLQGLTLHPAFVESPPPFEGRNR